MLKLQEEHDFSHGDTTYTFSGLNGDVDKFYQIMGYVEFHATTWRNLYLIPNNDVVSAYMTENHFAGWQNNLTHDRGGFTDKGFIIMRSQQGVTQTIIQGIIYAKSGLRRGSRFKTFNYDLAGDDHLVHEFGTQWVDTATNLTSLVFKVEADHLNSGKLILSRYSP